MFSFAAKKVLGGATDKLKDKHDQAGGVNWQEFNYPPCLTVVHFDPVNDAIPVLARDTVLRMRMLWYAIMAILFFNVCTNIGLVGAGAEAGVVILYSCLQLVFGSVAGGATLYQGYRGVAGDLVRSSRIYIGVQSALTVLMVVFCAIQSGNLHGFEGITSRKLDRPQPGYLVICIVEGMMWLLCALGSMVVMLLVYKYPGHDRANREAAAAAAVTHQQQSSRKSRRAKGGGDDDAHPPRDKDRKKKSHKSKSKKAPPQTADLLVEPEDDVV